MLSSVFNDVLERAEGFNTDANLGNLSKFPTALIQENKNEVYFKIEFSCKNLDGGSKYNP